MMGVSFHTTRNVCISGPTTLTAQDRENVTRNFEQHVRSGDTVVSGAAHGVDTIGAKAAKDLGARLLIVRPTDLWHNEYLLSIADEIIDVYGTYMQRNDRLAQEGDVLIAYPPTAHEEVRSGTWATVRRFRALGKPVTIVPLDSL